MKGWDLFRHSVAMISRDVGAAFRVTGLPYVIILVVMLTFPGVFGTDPDADVTIGPAVLLGFIALFGASLWLAVQWHRYVLMGEIQNGVVPPWHGGAILAYLWRSIILGLLAIPIILVVFVPVGFLLISAEQPDGVIMGFSAFATALGLTILGRFSLILPAAALGESMTLRKSWQATRGATGAIFVMSILLSLLSSLPSFLFLAGLGIVAVVANLAFQWLVTVLGVSVITTLYGHYAEGRELT